MLKKTIYLFFLSWSLLLFLASGIVESQDGLQYLTVARQIYYHHTFEMPAAKYPHDNINMNTQVGRDGKEFSPTGLGYSLALIPAVIAEDTFNKIAQLSPTEKFPLDNDWPIMLFGSMTNAVFGALFIVTTFLFLKTFRFNDLESVLLSIILFFSSNLLVYSKHSFAHMMFVSFMWLSFYFIRKYRMTQKRKHIFFAAASYGIVILSYNPTYFLLLPALGIYYLFSIRWIKLNLVVRQIFLDFLTALIGILPFLLIYAWFNFVRFGGSLQTGYGTGGVLVLAAPPPFVFFEGFWGLLFSPGKSFFLFTPIALLPLIYWFKWKWQDSAEVISALVLFLTYLVIIASLVGGDQFFPWHGEASFGPRYLLPTIPMILLLVALLFKRISIAAKKIIFWPIVTVGLLIQVVGILIPYQVRFSGLEYQYVLNGYRITYDVYANFLPRFSPLYSMTKWCIRELLATPRNYFMSPAVVFIDGTHGILKTPDGSFREIESLATLLVKNKQVLTPLTIEIQNYQATSSANKALIVTAQGKRSTSEVIIPGGETKSITVAPENLGYLDQINLHQSYQGTSSSKVAQQYTFVSSLGINGEPVKLEGYYYPYVSRVSEKLFGIKYGFWGKKDSQLWDLWNMRSVIYVNTLDLWWLKPLHYWDLPKNFYLILFLGNASIFSTVLVLLFREIHKRKQ